MQQITCDHALDILRIRAACNNQKIPILGICNLPDPPHTVVLIPDDMESHHLNILHSILQQENR